MHCSLDVDMPWVEGTHCVRQEPLQLKSDTLIQGNTEKKTLVTAITTQPLFDE